MAKYLVIVESPAKASTIKKILGKNYLIKASYGHVRDLPKSKFGVDIENNFDPKYITIKGKGEVIKELKKEAKKSDKVFLASDPDREGEAIAWHVSNAIDAKSIYRIEFNEITQTAVKNSIKNPRQIDMNKVNAQQARRILDRLVGYQISPLLWQMISGNTSAGRVQSVALKLICDLEEIIVNFIPEEFWEVSGDFSKNITLNLNKIDKKRVTVVKDKKVVDEIRKELKNQDFDVVKTKVSKKTRKPPLPLKTSTLQQLSSSYLGFSASKTMRVAQSLYEGIKMGANQIGLITYMRTDSFRISDEAKKKAQDFIKHEYGDKYVGDYFSPKAKGNVQDAHEAIRPTDVFKVPSEIQGYLNKDQNKLYKLIWERFLISQFAHMKYEQFEIIANYSIYDFKGIMNKIIFDGYYKIFKDEEDIKTADFPKINEGDKLTLEKLNIKAGKTKPPARLTESSLVKKLEAEGIGRPSTYAAIIETLKKRDYVKLTRKTFFPTDLGFEVKNKLEKYFPNIMNVKFTAEMEEKLDNIAEGKDNWVDVLEKFNNELKEYLEDFERLVEKIKNKKIYSDVKCDTCNGKMLLKTGRFGKFLECENYGECKERVKLPKEIKISEEDINKEQIYVKEELERKLQEKKGIPTDLNCDSCDGIMMLKVGRYGDYLECEHYKECKERKSIPKGITYDKDMEIIEISDKIRAEEEKDKKIATEAGKCEKCGGEFVVKKGRYGKFLACNNYPDCKNIKKYPKPAGTTKKKKTTKKRTKKKG